jgi:ABC-type antimicrobial peptide transport system permease subunit
MAVVRMVLGDLFRLAGAGVLVAIPVAYGMGSLIRSQLFGVTPADPVSLAAAVVLVAAVALVAALVPARRAAQVNPIEALRTE